MPFYLIDLSLSGFFLRKMILNRTRKSYDSASSRAIDSASSRAMSKLRLLEIFLFWKNSLLMSELPEFKNQDLIWALSNIWAVIRYKRCQIANVSRNIVMPPLRRNSSTMSKFEERMETTMTFTTCKEIHFVECVRQISQRRWYLREGGNS